MNKKIKLIELLNKIANGEDLPKRIKIQEFVFELSKDYEHYYYNADVEITHLINHNFSNLNTEIEILEDNTEEIEELSTYRTFAEYDELAKKCINMNAEQFFYKINELVKAVNEIRKENKK